MERLAGPNRRIPVFVVAGGREFFEESRYSCVFEIEGREKESCSECSRARELWSLIRECLLLRRLEPIYIYRSTKRQCFRESLTITRAVATFVPHKEDLQSYLDVRAWEHLFVSPFSAGVRRGTTKRVPTGVPDFRVTFDSRTRDYACKFIRLI